MRVHELAKEYNTTSKEIIKTLIDNRENATGKTGKWSHLSKLSNDQIVQLGYVLQSGDSIVESEYKEELEMEILQTIEEDEEELKAPKGTITVEPIDDDYDEKGPIDFDEEAAKETGTELSMEPEKDDWTLGSGDVVVETDKVDIDTEEVIADNVETAGEARKEYAKTVANITENPDTWATPKLENELLERSIGVKEPLDDRDRVDPSSLVLEDVEEEPKTEEFNGVEVDEQLNPVDEMEDVVERPVEIDASFIENKSETTEQDDKIEVTEEEKQKEMISAEKETEDATEAWSSMKELARQDNDAEWTKKVLEADAKIAVQKVIVEKPKGFWSWLKSIFDWLL